MKSLRKALFWLHLCAALTAGTVILLLAATGLLLAFEAQIQNRADAPFRSLPVPAGATALPLESLLATVAAERPELAVTSVTLRNEPGAAVTLGLGREGVLYVDPYRGAIAGPGATSVRRFFRGVTDLHRFLGASGPARAAGKRTTGVATLLFAVILLSGSYLWFPRRIARSRFRDALWFRRGLNSKARDFNWHHVFGIWALLPLLLVVVSALPESFEWANDLVLGAGGGAARTEPPRPAPGATSAPTSAPTAATATSAPAAAAAAPPRNDSPKLATLSLVGIDAAVARAAAETPAWRSLSLRLPARGDGAWTVTTDRAARRGRPDLRTRLVVDTASGAVVERESFADQPPGRRVRSWMRWVHTGEAGALAGQTIAALACAAVLFLGWTGYALAWRRCRAWLARRRVTSARGLVRDRVTAPIEE